MDNTEYIESLIKQAFNNEVSDITVFSPKIAFFVFRKTRYCLSLFCDNKNYLSVDTSSFGVSNLFKNPDPYDSSLIKLILEKQVQIFENKGIFFSSDSTNSEISYKLKLVFPNLDSYSEKIEFSGIKVINISWRGEIFEIVYSDGKIIDIFPKSKEVFIKALIDREFTL